jgi:hypothetical protein
MVRPIADVCHLLGPPSYSLQTTFKRLQIGPPEIWRWYVLTHPVLRLFFKCVMTTYCLFSYTVTYFMDIANDEFVGVVQE